MVPSIIENTIPAEVVDNDLLVNPVHVIDLAFALPGLIFGSVLLWRRQSLGFVIVSFAMVFMVILTVALAAMVIMMFVRGISEDYTLAIVFGALSIASVAMAALLFRKIVS